MIFDWPVGTNEERGNRRALPGAWITATRYGERYQLNGRYAIHTGLDLNLNTPTWNADAHSPVYAPADGLVMFAGSLPVWGSVIVIKHDDHLEQVVWTRCAHVEDMKVKAGDTILRGELIARVGNADGRYPYHLHYDVAVIDLGDRPADWPGDNPARVKKSYLDPIAFMNSMREENILLPVLFRVTARPTLRVRSEPRMYTPVVGYLPFGALVRKGEVTGEWMHVEETIDGRYVNGWIYLAYVVMLP